MGLLFIPLCLLLGCTIVFFEVMRKKKDKIDFLTGFNFIYFLCFVIAPLYLFGFKEDIPANWMWLYKTELDSINFLYAGFLSALGYLTVILGFYFFKKLRLGKNIGDYSNDYFSKITDKQILKFGLFIGSIGLAAFTIYTIELGGVARLIQLGILLRSNAIEVHSPWLFLKNITPFIMISSYCFYALAKSSKNKNIRRFSQLLFFVSLAVSMLHLFHQAGRMTLLVYVMTFPLSNIVFYKKIKLRYLISGVAFFVFLVLFGKQLFNMAVYSTGMLNRLDTIQEGNLISLLMVEFCFPFATLGNVASTVPTNIDFRYFIDLILGFLSILPDTIFSSSDIKTVNAVNTDYFGTSGAIPVDLISFGYYSLGLLGVIMTCFVFGMIMSLCDSLFSAKSTYFASILKVAWIIFLSFRICYADPKNVLVAGFALISSTLLLFLFYRSKSKRATSNRKAVNDITKLGNAH